MIYECDPLQLTIILSGLMALIAMVLYIIVIAIEPKYPARSGDAIEPYIGGEHPSILSRPLVPEANLYWSFIKRNFVKAYCFLKEKMHTGRFSDWVNYMAMWMALLFLISLIVIIVLIIGGV